MILVPMGEREGLENAEEEKMRITADMVGLTLNMPIMKQQKFMLIYSNSSEHHKQVWI